jgi:diacylglycerol O-acyltransferase 1
LASIQDRTIGWGGTKWSLRFVSLQGGKILYFGSHRDDDPRYVLALRGCAVRDEGYKVNKRHKSTKTTTNNSNSHPSIEDSGAYFHVFSIYQRLEDDTEILPLLRFSTPSLASKNQWMTLISEACVYADTDEFLEAEQAIQREEELRRQQHLAMAHAMPQSTEGTLPPLYFGTTTSNKSKSQHHRRHPSSSKLSYQTKSTSRDAERVDTHSRKNYPPSKPMHREAAPSYLSEEAPVQNYRGLFNLAMIVLALSNARLILDTIRRHGFFADTVIQDMNSFLTSSNKWDDFPLLTGFLGMHIVLYVTFGIELILSTNRVSNAVGMILHHLNAHSFLLFSCWIVWVHIPNPFTGATLLFHVVILWMKLLSYALANEDYRMSKDSAATLEALVKDLDPGVLNTTYPSNITLSNLYYFWMAPTLTYQIAFPRTDKIRIWRVASLLLRFFFVLILLLFLIAQVITPTLRSLVHDLEATNGKLTFHLMAEYGLRLSLANTYCWLLVFYGYFHVYLNLSAELLRFGDRVFYKDWWNSSDVSSYWRLWNMPVHYWLVRHVFFPCVRRGLSKTMATFVVFFLSAVFHELLISLPFHMIRPWAYLGMMGQVPLVWITKGLTKKLPGTSMGNIIFWLSFCIVGQPMAILMYTIDYQYQKETENVLSTNILEQVTKNFLGIQVSKKDEL